MEHEARSQEEECDHEPNSYGTHCLKCGAFLAHPSQLEDGPDDKEKVVK